MQGSPLFLTLGIGKLLLAGSRGPRPEPNRDTGPCPEAFLTGRGRSIPCRQTPPAPAWASDRRGSFQFSGLLPVYIFVSLSFLDKSTGILIIYYFPSLVVLRYRKDRRGTFLFCAGPSLQPEPFAAPFSCSALSDRCFVFYFQLSIISMSFVS